VGLALALAGCGGAAPRSAELHLERTDLVLVGRTLARLQRPIGSEIAGARTIWPELAPGLPAKPLPAMRQSIATVAAQAGTLTLPAPFALEDGLTGPAAGLGALLRSYTTLTQHGWQFIAAALAGTTGAGKARAVGAGGTAGGRSAPADSLRGNAGPSFPRRGSARADFPRENAGSNFLRDNAGLYIYCVYDGHYDLSLIGKRLQAAYRKLGGPRAFGGALTQAQVDELAGAYSIPSARLVPHPPESLGV
jgi:hypothetical protein